MKTAERSSISYSGSSIAKNTVYNLLGYGVPLIFALVLIPPLIKGLGTERFGILSLAWMVIGYFTFFDFGIGKGLTKIVSERIGINKTHDMAEVFWTSLFLMLAVSFLVSFILLFFIPSIVGIFNISSNMRHETTDTFYVLALSIPIVSTTAGLRGVLEAYQKFGIINIMRVILGVFTFLGPLLVLILTNSLFWIVVALIIIRFIIWLLYLFHCFRVNEDLRNGLKFDFNSIKPVLSFSIWITIANIVGPLILYSDRFLIGVLISASAITFYATPFEVVTKLLLIPGALTGVLFPIFSASFFNNPNISKKILLRGIKFIFLIIYPIVFLIVMFSYEGIKLWLGEKFAMNSSLVLQFLSIGILMNCLSSIPDNFFQGIGKPKIPTIIMLTELPFYIFTMWFGIKNYGINGAALIFMLAAIVNVTTMYIIANKLFDIKFGTKFSIFSFSLMMGLLIFPFFITSLYLKLILTLGILPIFFYTSWNYFLTEEEKVFIISKIRFRVIK
jgi:O-antigen/teichoic acid export membrane protein